MFIKTSILLILIMFLLSFSTTIGQGIRVCGDVVNQLFPYMNIDSLLVIVEAGENTMKADYQPNEYNKLLPLTYLQKSISVRSEDKNYMQMNPIEFIPTHEGRYENILLIKHKKNIVEDLLRELKNLIKEQLYQKAHEKLEEAIGVDPQQRLYFIKVKFIGEWLKTDSLIPSDLLMLGEEVKYDEHFKNILPKFQYEFYLQLGIALSDSARLMKNEKVNLVKSHYDITIEAFDDAIAINNRDARAYQGKYLVQYLMGFYFDMIQTIKQFFNKNQNLNNEKTIKVFLTDWTTGIEKLIGYPKIKQSQYSEEWEELYLVLQKYEKFYRVGDKPIDKRLRTAQINANELRR